MSSRSRRVALSAAAQADLREVLAYTQRQWGTGQRLAYRRRIFDALEHLAAFPELGKVRSEHGDEVRGFHVGQHLVVYRFSSTALIVARLLHVRRDNRDDEDDIL